MFSANPDGSDLKTIVSEGRRLPDGIVVDVEAGHIYWTNMGNPSANDGSIERADLDGSNVTNIVPPGGTFTPKQLQLDKKNRKLYWCDREGMRVMRANLDGSKIETLSIRAKAMRVLAKTQEMVRGDRPRRRSAASSIGRRKALTTPARDVSFARISKFRRGRLRQTAKTLKSSIEDLPEPIDLDLDLANRTIYWTDRGDPPRGNTVNRAPMDAGSRQSQRAGNCFQPLDGRNRPRVGPERRPHVLDRFGGSVYSANLDGSNKKTLLAAREPDRNRLCRTSCALVTNATIGFTTKERNELAGFCFKTRERGLRKERPDCVCDAQPAQGAQRAERDDSELRAAFEDARDDSAVRGVILTGAGDKAFAAGADIGEMDNDTAVTAEQKTRGVRRSRNSSKTWENLSSPQ